MASSPYSPYTPPAGQMPSGQSPPRNAKTLHKLAANNDGNDSSPTNGSHHQDTESLGVCACCLYMLSTAFFVLTYPFTWCFLIKIVNQYERAVIFRLGQLTPGGAKGPGLFFINPCTDVYRKVDMRTVMIDVPPQEVLTKDSVTVKVDAVVYFHVFDATIAIVNVARASDSTKLLSQTTLRTVLGTKTLTELLVERDQIREEIREVLDEATDGWGIKVERVEITDVKLPKQMQRMMAAEAEADREAKAKVVAAEGEKRASMALRDAAATMADAPATLQLRYLQTLQTISSEHNSTIVFPFPVDLIAALLDRIQPSPAKTWATASSQPPSGISRIHHPPPPLPHRPHHQLATTPPAMDQQQPAQLPQDQLLQVVVQQPQQLYEDVEHVTDPSMRTAQQITL